MEPLYPLEDSLSADMMCLRLALLNRELHAVRDWMEPNPDKALHVLVKNNIGLKPFPTSAGSKFFENLFLPDAFCVKCLREADVDLFGTTNMTELAGFVTTRNPLMGYSYIGGFPINPWGEDEVPGGSSTGSAIAVRAGFCDAALGTETRGSVMYPALACGVYGFKPSRGSISRSGIIPLSSILDTPGILARNLATIRELFGIMAQKDHDDAVCARFYDCHQAQPAAEVKRAMRLGVLHTKDNILKTRSVAERINRAGLETKMIELPITDFAYKKISSLDFLDSMTAFIKDHRDQLKLKNAEDLIEAYRNDEEASMFGMDRLEDALTFPHEPHGVLEASAWRQILAARDTIRATLQENDCDYLVTPEFVDWWSISGAPSIALPLSACECGLRGLMIGGTFGRDADLLNTAETLDAGLKAAQ